MKRSALMQVSESARGPGLRGNIRNRSFGAPSGEREPLALGDRPPLSLSFCRERKVGKQPIELIDSNGAKLKAILPYQDSGGSSFGLEDQNFLLHLSPLIRGIKES
jgi:hypothetical protein